MVLHLAAVRDMDERAFLCKTHIPDRNYRDMEKPQDGSSRNPFLPIMELMQTDGMEMDKNLVCKRRPVQLPTISHRREGGAY